MKITIPLNITDVYKQTDIPSGKLVKSKAFGWGVYGGEAHFTSYDPPYKDGDKTTMGLVESVRLEDNNWLVTIKEIEK